MAERVKVELLAELVEQRRRERALLALERVARKLEGVRHGRKREGGRTAGLRIPKGWKIVPDRAAGGAGLWAATRAADYVPLLSCGFQVFAVAVLGGQ